MDAFNSKKVVVIAGPCAIESKEQLLEVAKAVKEAGIKYLRGGAYKPRSSPYSFQGLGEEGLKYLSEAGKRFGLTTITEVTDSELAELVAKYVDVLQVGARNMDNYSLLKKLGKITALNKKTVLLKRGFSAKIEEWLLAAEYITSAGNPNVVLCERGIRTFETATRFTLDLNAVPVVKKLSTHPIVVDTSHSTGHADMVIPMSRAAVAAGADGIMVEVHPNPKKALCDGAQSLTPIELEQLIKEIRPVAKALGKDIG
ncbi:3-deoxy-7-phosphoheptulonate synthase [Candidatus Oleimmundimicrobium sp.]|uniref:3-deoxy-7-phosphoheptulonate synthase n=1 Tax=Candidatus Oleimmundimicrobium sp. TaxID=3060597 RepID=UPI00271C3FD5|nr:3-deoxy-7-phosphoheptulonate synthase [Candidatus Oleimmundimicrobium sp.]MDO8886001.1 3-deoxy-7-phosphoheptulonate synthase [Candidatus Oleimmundimicrobium sp.]